MLEAMACFPLSLPVLCTTHLTGAERKAAARCRQRYQMRARTPAPQRHRPPGVQWRAPTMQDLKAASVRQVPPDLAKLKVMSLCFAQAFPLGGDHCRDATDKDGPWVEVRSNVCLCLADARRVPCLSIPSQDAYLELDTICHDPWCNSYSRTEQTPLSTTPQNEPETLPSLSPSLPPSPVTPSLRFSNTLYIAQQTACLSGTEGCKDEATRDASVDSVLYSNAPPTALYILGRRVLHVLSSSPHVPVAGGSARESLCRCLCIFNHKMLSTMPA